MWESRIYRYVLLPTAVRPIGFQRQILCLMSNQTKLTISIQLFKFKTDTYTTNYTKGDATPLSARQVVKLSKNMAGTAYQSHRQVQTNLVTVNAGITQEDEKGHGSDSNQHQLSLCPQTRINAIYNVMLS